MPPAPCTTGSTMTAATSRWCWLSRSVMATISLSGQGPSKAQFGAGANRCRGNISPNRWCMPVTGSQTAIAPKVSP